jgi:hypothetical protein
VDRGGDARTPQPPRYGCDPERQRVICRRLTRSDPEDDGRTRFLKPEPFAASDGILQPSANPPPTSQGRSVCAAFRHRARLYIAVPIPPTSPVPLCQLATNCRVELPCPQAFFLELQSREGLRSCATARSHYGCIGLPLPNATKSKDSPESHPDIRLIENRNQWWNGPRII